MPLAFPHRDDNIRLKRSPLVEVICQVRFPPILSIPAQKPVQFQERIRRRFPDFEVENSVRFELGVPSNLSAPAAATQTINRTYKFVSRKRGNTVTLAEDFFALSSTKYVVWEEFAADLQLASESVTGIYEPSHATRIGLRYVNVLDPEKLELSSLADVTDLLQPELRALYRADVWSEPSVFGVQLILDDEEGQLGFRMATRDDDGKRSLQLDFDYFQEDEDGLPLEDLVQRCERYHRVVYDAFRWSILDDRIDDFEPVPKRESPA